MLVILLLVSGLAFTAVTWRGGVHMTFSQHAAATRWSKIFYAILFLITLPLLAWFVASWFVPHKHLPQAFVWFTCIAVLFQIVCTWFPEEGGWKTTLHRGLTGVSGIAMLPLVVILATSSGLSLFVRIASWAALCFMVTLLAVALSHQKGFKWALLLQIGYYSAFFLVLLLATYL